MPADNSGSFVLRPFEGIPGEADLVAMREIVPAATAKASLTKEYGAREITFVTSLPESWPALHRTDGTILVALQTHAGSGDPSRDLADTILTAIDLEPGTPVIRQVIPEPGPRLQDILDLTKDIEAEVHADFEFWLDPSADRSSELDASLKEAAEAIVDTVKLNKVPHAFWCRMGAREFLRWSFAEDEDTMLNGIARLHAKRDAQIADGKFIGAFRAEGISIPVWELPRGTEAEEIEDEAAAFLPKFEAAMALTEPLDANERRARAGIVARQKTLR
ncbi:DUF5926 family protein [Rarobacter faecitabidus]|uniref:DUF5926 domain-containing protein n=1 Tax=Rarobacter faecitabidus TaxID=13243 RepID=A0A542ZAY9_RARFA|nr:DUF5926 family protein [Rarobacter faecitabidus]TQL57505.1 hypothetical protein FB461_2246 [Rarobacter faecitabidus]